MLAQLLLPIILLVFFYLVLIRPQQKNQKKVQAMQNDLQKGDKIVTIGGLHGTVDAIDGDKLVIKSPDGSRLTFDRQAIRTVTEKKEQPAAVVEE